VTRYVVPVVLHQLRNLLTRQVYSVRPGLQV